ncbi:MAG: ATP-binding domain-containing protein, partial [Chitinophagaceae bacterium]|nr:ATP-binding domain-containing protein [Rubrivivax sp.]
AAALLAVDDPNSPWFVGRPVMVLRNDPVLRLFNGDIGITLPAPGGGDGEGGGALAVYFPDGESGLRALAPVRLPEHQTAFAMTVHKAQGSEFDEVLVVLPAKAGRVLTRELLYTAITRARKRVTLSGPAEVVTTAIGSPTRRDSGLLARLREAADEAKQ